MNKNDVLQQLRVASQNSKACNRDEFEVWYAVYLFLLMVNSGRMEGEMRFRINGHAVSGPKLDDCKLSLERVKEFCVGTEDRLLL